LPIASLIVGADLCGGSSPRECAERLTLGDKVWTARHVDSHDNVRWLAGSLWSADPLVLPAPEAPLATTSTLVISEGNPGDVLVRSVRTGEKILAASVGSPVGSATISGDFLYLIRQQQPLNADTGVIQISLSDGHQSELIPPGPLPRFGEGARGRVVVSASGRTLATDVCVGGLGDHGIVGQCVVDVIDIQTGERWQVPSTDTSSLWAVTDDLFIGAEISDQTVAEFGRDLRTGELLWRREAYGHNYLTRYLAGDGAWVVEEGPGPGHSGFSVLWIDPRTGQEAARYAIPTETSWLLSDLSGESYAVLASTDPTGAMEAEMSELPLSVLDLRTATFYSDVFELALP